MIKLTANQNHNKEETRNNPISKQTFWVLKKKRQEARASNSEVVGLQRILGKRKKYEKGELCVWVVGGEERETETRDKRTPTNIVT